MKTNQDQMMPSASRKRTASENILPDQPETGTKKNCLKSGGLEKPDDEVLWLANLDLSHDEPPCIDVLHKKWEALWKEQENQLWQVDDYAPPRKPNSMLALIRTIEMARWQFLADLRPFKEQGIIKGYPPAYENSLQLHKVHTETEEKSMHVFNYIAYKKNVFNQMETAYDRYQTIQKPLERPVYQGINLSQQEALWQAIESADLRKLDVLIHVSGKYFDINQKDKNGYHPVFRAAQLEYAQSFEKLLMYPKLDIESAETLKQFLMDRHLYYQTIHNELQFIEKWFLPKKFLSLAEIESSFAGFFNHMKSLTVRSDMPVWDPVLDVDWVSVSSTPSLDKDLDVDMLDIGCMSIVGDKDSQDTSMSCSSEEPGGALGAFPAEAMHPVSPFSRGTMPLPKNSRRISPFNIQRPKSLEELDQEVLCKTGLAMRKSPKPT